MTPENEGSCGFQEFVCEAIPAPGVPLRATPSTWTSDDPLLVIHEGAARAPEAQSGSREAELVRLASTELCQLVNTGAEQLSLQELITIWRIAYDRATGTGPDREESSQLASLVGKIIAARPR